MNTIPSQMLALMKDSRHLLPVHQMPSVFMFKYLSSPRVYFNELYLTSVKCDCMLGLDSIGQLSDFRSFSHISLLCVLRKKLMPRNAQHAIVGMQYLRNCCTKQETDLFYICTSNIWASLLCFSADCFLMFSPPLLPEIQTPFKR